MKIAMIGTGRVGKALAHRLILAGHEVIFGSRTPEADTTQSLIDELNQLIPQGAEASATTAPQAAALGDVVFLAVPFRVAKQTLDELGDLDGKVLIDCTNPVSPTLDSLTLGHTNSAGEEIARWAKSARVVKAFNTTGSQNMREPVYPQGPLTMFICGDDADANDTVAMLAGKIGFKPCITGPLRHARYLEAMVMLWIELAIGQGRGPDIGFILAER